MEEEIRIQSPETDSMKPEESLESEPVFEIKPVRKRFSRIGFALSGILLVANLAQILMLLIASWIGGPNNWLVTSSWGKWITTFVPMQLIAMPVSMLILQGIPAKKIPQAPLGGKYLFVFVMIFLFISYAGSFIGTFISLLLSNGQATNDIAELVMDMNPLKIVTIVILAPLLEEFICRKMIIDRTVQYGEKIAIILSGLTFGLLHGNFFQFFYTSIGGMLLAYLYVRTGRLRYSVTIHMIMNFMGAVIAPFILSQLDLELLSNLDPTMPEAELLAIYGAILPGLLLYLGYLVLIMGIFVTGLVLFIIYCRKLIFKPSEDQLPKGTCFKTVYLNIGMILFVLLCAASMALALFS